MILRNIRNSRRHASRKWLSLALAVAAFVAVALLIVARPARHAHVAHSPRLPHASHLLQSLKEELRSHGRPQKEGPTNAVSDVIAPITQGEFPSTHIATESPKAVPSFIPPTSSSQNEGLDVGDGVTCMHFDTSRHDNVEQANPGGTEADALAARRKQSLANGLHTPADRLRWRPGMRRPTVPEALRCVAGSLPSHVELPLEKAMVACGGRNRFRCVAEHMLALLPRADDGQCSDVYGAGLLHRFDKSNVDVCSGQGTSEVRCRAVRVHTDHQIDTSVCEARNVAVHFDRMLDGDYPWLAFERGALRTHCAPHGHHLRFMHCQADWMTLGFEATSGTLECARTDATPTLFLTRSGDFSPFAAIHDYVNAALLYFIGDLDARRTQIVVMDRMGGGFYTPMWQLLFATEKPLVWFPDVRSQTTCYERAWFNIPARLSPIYNHDECGAAPLFRIISDLLLHAAGALRMVPTARQVVVTVITRRNYGTGHSIGRRIGNHAALVAQLRSGLQRSFPTVVNDIDFADFDFDQQLAISRSSDVLLGMHGAGLVQMLFMPQHGGVFEFFCPEKPSSNYRYQQLAAKMGLRYASFDINREDNVLDIDAALPHVWGLVNDVHERKLKASEGYVQ